MKKKAKKPAQKRAGLTDPTQDVKSTLKPAETWKDAKSTEGTEPDLEKNSAKPKEPDLH
jgi:hypothetical protein